MNLSFLENKKFQKWMLPLGTLGYLSIPLAVYKLSPLPDFSLYLSWFARGMKLPMRDFYSGDYSGGPGDWGARLDNTDRFPTDALLYSGVGKFIGLFSGEMAQTIVAMLFIALLPWLFLGLTMVGFYLLGRHFGVSRKGSAAGALSFGLLPPVYLISAIVITVELSAVALALFATLLLLKDKPWATLLSGVLSALVLLERPHFIFLLAPLFYLLWQRSKKTWGLYLLGGLGTGIGLPAFFRLGLFWDGGRGSLLDLFSYNSRFYEGLSRGGGTFWALFPDSMNTRYQAVNVLGVPVVGWTLIFMVILGGYAFFKLRKSTVGGLEAVTWGSALLAQGVFLFSPRMLERYNFPAVVLLFVLVFLARRWWPLLAGLALTSGLNIGLIMVALTREELFDPWVNTALQGVGVLNLLCLVLFFVLLPKKELPLKA